MRKIVKNVKIQECEEKNREKIVKKSNVMKNGMKNVNEKFANRNFN